MDFIWGIVLGFAIGWLIFGWKYNDGPAEQSTEIWVRDGPNHSIILRSLTLDKTRAIAVRIAAGRPFRYKTMCGRGRLLTRSQWDNFTHEAVQLGVLERGKNRIYTPTPLGEKFFNELAGPSHARTLQK